MLSLNDSSYFSLSPIKAIELKAAQIKDCVSLAQGIPSFHTPEMIKEYVIDKINASRCDKYSLTTGLSELREEIAATIYSEEGISYDPEREVIVTVGSIEGITASLLALLSPGDEVVLPSPTYASYLSAIKLARGVPKYFELDEENNFDFNLDKLKMSITKKTKVIILCLPNNPTGTIYSKEKLEAVYNIAKERGIYLLTDEVYKEFYYTNKVSHLSPIVFDRDKELVVRVFSFSKAFSMTGWRVGFLVANDKFTSNILRFHDAMVTCAPVVSQYGAIAALKFGNDFLKYMQAELKRRRDLVINALDDMSDIFDYQMPKAAYFVFPRIKDSIPLANNTKKLSDELLYRAKVAVVPGIAFGPSGESHIRINFGREENDLILGLERIADYFRGKKSQTKISRKHHASDGSKRDDFIYNLKNKAYQILTRILFARMRKRPIVIGIVGTKSKTLYRRVFQKELSKRYRVETTILSYNTNIGLFLSIYQLKSPKKGIKNLIKFVLGVAYKILVPYKADILILEYGCLSASEAKEQASIVKPDMLVISSDELIDPNLNKKDFTECISYFKTIISANSIISFQDIGHTTSSPTEKEGPLSFYQARVVAKYIADILQERI